MHQSREIMHRELDASRILYAGRYQARRGSLFPMHAHDCWEWVYYQEGCPHMHIGSELFKAHPGIMLITPPGIFHDEDAQTNYSNLYILVDAPARMPWPRACLDDTHGSMGNIMETIVREWYGAELHREALLRFSFSSLAILVARNAVQPIYNTTERRGVAAKLWIENHFTQPWDTADLAQHIGISPGHLRDQFQRMYGKSPLEYGRHLRLQKAIVLLASSNFTLERIADLCGYHSPSHLSRHVKETTGQSLGALRTKRGHCEKRTPEYVSAFLGPVVETEFE